MSVKIPPLDEMPVPDAMRLFRLVDELSRTSEVPALSEIELVLRIDPLPLSVSPPVKPEVLPLYVLAALNTNVPLPPRVRLFPPAPEITPLKVRGFDVLLLDHV